MKLTKYFLSMAAAVGMIAGCQKAEIVQISAPEDIVAPVLEAYDGAIEITPTNMANEKAVFAWSPADYGVNTQVDYSLEVATEAAPANKVVITSGLTDTTMVAGTLNKTTIEYEKLNQILFNDLKLADGIAENVLFFIAAKVGETAKVYSNSITVSAKVTAAEKVYPKLYVVGSYNGWSHDKNQYLFDFAGTDAVYQGLVDFGADGADHSANEFKITGGAWGKDEHSMSGAHDAESKTISLVAGGGDNINVYQAKRYYHLTFDRALTLTADVSFDQIGVIGDFNGWGADAVMEFNASKQRFYADVEFPADGGFKFRLDGAWDVSYGSTGSGVLDSGDNIPVTAGSYRVYLNMNNFGEMTYELNAKMFGKDEPVAGTTTPEEPEQPSEPEQLVGWGLVGEFSGWADGKDMMLASDGTYLVAKGVELSGQFKFRKDGKWDTNLGATGEVEPFELTANSEVELVANGKNFTIAAGTYDVYLDEANAKAWFITDGSYPGGGAAPVASEWGIIGVAGDWSNNVTMYEEGEYIVAKGVTFSDNNEFKFRKGNTWGTELVYEGVVSPDAEYACAAGGGNSKIVQGGTYDVYLAATLDKFYIMTPGKTPAEAGEAQKTYTDPSADSFVVGFSGSAIGWDDPSFDTNDRAAFVSKNVTDATTFAGTYEFKLESFAVAENDAFKVRINGQWIGVGQATVEGLTVSGEGDFIAGESGTYTAVITFAWDGNASSDVKVVFSK